MPRPSRVVLALVLTPLALVILLAAAELAYRWRARDLPTPVRYYRHERLARAMVRDADYDGRIHINRLGLRGPDVAVEKPQGTSRIVVFGASTTFDPCVRDDAATWPARLEHWLATLAPARSFQVVNAGVSGAPMLDHLVRLTTELASLDADVVMVYAGHGIVAAADAFPPDPTRVAKPGAVGTAAPWDPWLREHSRLYARLRPLRDASGGPDGRELTDADWRRAIDNAAHTFEDGLSALTAVARAQGADVVFIEINRVTGERDPSTFSDGERAAWRAAAAPTEVVHDGYVRFDSIWQSVADELGATYITADRIDVTGPEHYCTSDPIHFSTAGSELMARRLAEQLLASGVL